VEKIVIAVGSTRRPKLDAVSEALTSFGRFLGESAQFEVTGVDVPSGVRHTPLTREDLMAGARQRAEALLQIAREKNERWTYFVGLEGGLDVVGKGDARRVFLENWAYVSDGTGRGFFGLSGGVLLPDALAKRVVDEGVELSEAIDAFAGGRGIRDAQGAWGILTRNLITRQDAFRIAVINAFAPFFNSAIYSL
jgi:inosine/xanthosine triphosphatase